MVGMTGCGKSQLARALHLSAPGPGLVIDPADSTLTVTPGCVTFSDPARATNARGENWRQAAWARFVPTDPDDLDAYELVFRWAFAHGPRRVWADEAATIMPARQSPKAAKRYAVQGRKRELGLQSCTTRPREISPYLRSDSEHVIVFGRLGNPDDFPLVAALLGLDLGECRRELAALPQYGFLWGDRRRNVTTACPPIKL